MGSRRPSPSHLARLAVDGMHLREGTQRGTKAKGRSLARWMVVVSGVSSRCIPPLHTITSLPQVCSPVHAPLATRHSPLTTHLPAHLASMRCLSRFLDLTRVVKYPGIDVVNPTLLTVNIDGPTTFVAAVGWVEPWCSSGACVSPAPTYFPRSQAQGLVKRRAVLPLQ